MNDVKIHDNFRILREPPSFPKRLQKKIIYVGFPINRERKERFMQNGFNKAKHLLEYLEAKYGLEGFELILIEDEKKEPFSMEDGKEKKRVIVNLHHYTTYGKEIDKVIKKLKVRQYSDEIRVIFSKKVPEYFFDGKQVKILIDEIDKSHYRIIEEMIKNWEKMPDAYRNTIMSSVEHSTLGTKIIEKWVKLEPESTAKQVKLFSKVIEKLNNDEIKELLDLIFIQKKNPKILKCLKKLPRGTQAIIIGSTDKEASILNLHKELKRSLRKFKVLIKERKNATDKNETKIHSFLATDYWLLGVEYFNKVIRTSINEIGKKVNETAFYHHRAIPDFCLETIDRRVDYCVVIELEEANDSIFNKDRSLSVAVFDGINQAKNYVVLKQLEGFASRGIAVIGSAGHLGKKERKLLAKLKIAYPDIEILTYEDIIEKAETVISFIENYTHKKKVKDLQDHTINLLSPHV